MAKSVFRTLAFLVIALTICLGLDAQTKDKALVREFMKAQK